MDKSDTIHQIYSKQKIRQQLIDYIYSVIDIQKFKYIVLKTQSDLELLTTTRYSISGNYAGNNCLLVFTKNKDRVYSFLVDRKTLKFEQSRINIDGVNMMPINIGLEESIYEGTIMDGIYVQNGDTKTYIITDVYMFRGTDMVKEKLKHKLFNIKSYFDRFICQNPHVSDLTVVVNNLYNIYEIDNFIKNIIPNTKQLQVKGITFYPEISGTKLIFLFKGEQDTYDIIQPKKQEHIQCQHNRQYDSKQQYYIQQPQKIQPTTQHTDIQIIPKQSLIHYVNKTDEPVYLSFEIRKTDKCDVYKLYLIEKEQDKMRARSYGIAYIPTLDCSRMCKHITISSDRVIVKCKFDESKEKWIPMEHEPNKKRPDYTYMLESKLDIIVDEE